MNPSSDSKKHWINLILELHWAFLSHSHSEGIILYTLKWCCDIKPYTIFFIFFIFHIFFLKTYLCLLSKQSHIFRLNYKPALSIANWQDVQDLVNFFSCAGVHSSTWNIVFWVPGDLINAPGLVANLVFVHVQYMTSLLSIIVLLLFQ